MKTMTGTTVTMEPITTAIYIPEESINAEQMDDNMKITLLMRQPVTSPCLVPVLHSSTPSCINKPFMVDGECFKLTAMSFGTPHGAVFVDDVDEIDVETVGSDLGTHKLFPEGASIVFAQVTDNNSLKVRLWERDIGECDFTAEAVSVAGTAAIMLQKVLGCDINVSMGGEEFNVNWDRFGAGVKVTGSAKMITA